MWVLCCVSIVWLLCDWYAIIVCLVRDYCMSNVRLVCEDCGVRLLWYYGAIMVGLVCD